jgi:hypothetical protein
MNTPIEQPEPIHTDEKPVWEMVIEDMKQRDNLGRQRYGTPLQVSNGRDALRDAYEEALDLAVYLRQEIERRSSSNSRANNELEKSKATNAEERAQIHSQIS